MSMTRAKRLGNAAENALAAYLKPSWPFAESNHGAGRNDKGDITGTPDICWECKAAVRQGYDFPGWLRELAVERENLGAKFGLVVVKPRGVGVERPEGWWALMPLPQAVDLLAFRMLI